MVKTKNIVKKIDDFKNIKKGSGGALKVVNLTFQQKHMKKYPK